MLRCMVGVEEEARFCVEDLYFVHHPSPSCRDESLCGISSSSTPVAKYPNYRPNDCTQSWEENQTHDQFFFRVHVIAWGAEDNRQANHRADEGVARSLHRS